MLNSRLSVPALTASLWTSLLTWVAPALALEVQVTPTQPKLGETVSIVVAVDNPDQPPQITIGGQALPAFPLGGDRYRAFFPTSPLDRPGQRTLQIQGDGETRTVPLQLQNRSFPTQRLWLRGGGNGATQYELDRVAAFKAIVSPEKHWNARTPFTRPTSGRVSTLFGVRRYYNGEFAQDYYHRGVDYAASTGTPVVAPAPGYIRLVDREANGFRIHGNTVGIDHGQGVLSIMIHLHSISVREGDFVQAGQTIGTVGNTGASTGPHLHWGLYVNGIAVDPVPWRYDGLE